MTQTIRSATQVAFVTGANRGIGLQTAEELGKEGVTVVLGVRDPAKAEATLAALRAQGVTAEAVVWDAARPETDAAVAKHLGERYGRLDILVNNAGVLKEPLMGNSTASISETVLRETFDTNFFAVVRLTQALLPLLKKAPAARIVNLSSVLGSLTLHSASDSPIGATKAFAYNASKTALNAFTVHLAAELAGTNIKVNSAHPGWVKTELGGVHAPMEIADSARTSVRLALLGDDGPTGRFFHENDALPW